MKKVIVVWAAVMLPAGGGCGEEKDVMTAGSDRIELFNGADFTGWKLFIPDETVDVTTVWSVRDGVIHCTGVPTGYMRTEADYANYKLHVEWRWVAEAGNSGILLHQTGEDRVWPKCIECQLQAGNAGDFYMINGTFFEKPQEGRSMYRVEKKGESNEKPVGEWNVAEIICISDMIRVFINGEQQNEGNKASVWSGKICLQSEGQPIEFRNIRLEPLID